MFEDFLKEKHNESYMEGGSSEDISDHFETWLTLLDVEKLIEYGNEAMAQKRCLVCGRVLTEIVDRIAGKKTGHLFKCTNCAPDLIISIG